MNQCGGCGCSGGSRKKRHTRKNRKGGSFVGDALLAASAVGLHSYFSKKKGGAVKTKKRVSPPRRSNFRYF